MFDDIIDILDSSDDRTIDFDDEYLYSEDPHEFFHSHHHEAFDENIEPTNGQNIAFMSKQPPNHSTDGYIFQGSEKYKGFDVYRKHGHKYYWDCYKNIFVEIKS